MGNQTHSWSVEKHSVKWNTEHLKEFPLSLLAGLQGDPPMGTLLQDYSIYVEYVCTLLLLISNLEETMNIQREYTL